MSGILYLIQPTELLKTNTYKIGMSNSSTANRIKSYGAKTILYRIAEVDDVVNREIKLIETFNKEFTLHKGNEYFTGDIEEMKNVFDYVIAGEEKYTYFAYEKLMEKMMEQERIIEELKKKL